MAWKLIRLMLSYETKSRSWSGAVLCFTVTIMTKKMVSYSTGAYAGGCIGCTFNSPSPPPHPYCLSPPPPQPQTNTIDNGRQTITKKEKKDTDNTGLRR